MKNCLYKGTMRECFDRTTMNACKSCVSFRTDLEARRRNNIHHADRVAYTQFLVENPDLQPNEFFWNYPELMPHFGRD
jgi:hypothetical protein